MTTSLTQLAAVLLVDRQGRLLVQLRDEHAPNWPNVWGMPGGHREPDETVEQAAERELWEETRLRPDVPLRLFEVVELPALGRIKHFFYGPTSAGQEDVVVGEGAAIVFVPVEELFDGRPWTPGTAEVLARFVASPEYAALAGRR